jgi:hypothetical protein
MGALTAPIEPDFPLLIIERCQWLVKEAGLSQRGLPNCHHLPTMLPLVGLSSRLGKQIMPAFTASTLAHPRRSELLLHERRVFNSHRPFIATEPVAIIT